MRIGKTSITFLSLLAVLAFVGVGLAGSGEAHAQGYYAPGPGGPPPNGVYRSGLVVGFAVGGGNMALNCDGCGSLGGLAAEFHIGGMVAPRLALEFDISTIVHPSPTTRAAAHCRRPSARSPCSTGFTG